MIIVTAANGHLGKDTIEALLKQTSADNIVAAARDPKNLELHKPSGIGIRRADYDEPESLEEAFKGMDTLILIPSSVPIEQRIEQNNNVIAAAKSCGISKILFIGLLDAGEDSPLPWAKAVAATEQALADSGIPSTNLRMSLYMENFYEWPVFLARDGAISLAAEDGRVAYAARTDMADATAAAALGDGHAGKTYELTGPASLNYDEVTAILSEVKGEPVRYNRISSDELYDRVIKLGAPEYLAKGSIAMSEVCKNGAFDVVTSHIEELTGHAPVDFLNFVKQTKDLEYKVKMPSKLKA